jgi:hypothetical protein
MKKKHVPLDDIFRGSHLLVESDKVCDLLRQAGNRFGDDDETREAFIDYLASAPHFPVGDVIFVVSRQSQFLRCVRLDDPSRVLTLDTRLYRFVRASRDYIRSYPAEFRRAARRAGRIVATPGTFTIGRGSGRRPEDPPSGNIAA